MEYTKEQQEQISKEISPLQEAFIVGVIRAADKIGIDRDKLIAGSIAVLAISAEVGSYNDFKILPAADVEPVKHGKWKLGESGCMYSCSNCGVWAFPREAEEWKYCPNCGARMNGDVFKKGD